METLYYVRGNHGCGIAYGREDAERWLRLAAWGAAAEGKLFHNENGELDAIVPFPITDWGPVLEIQGRLPGTEIDCFQFLARWIPGMVVAGEPRNKLGWREVEDLLATGGWVKTPSGYLRREDGLRLQYDTGD